MSTIQLLGLFLPVCLSKKNKRQRNVLELYEHEYELKYIIILYNIIA